jgi:hypothetical protein
MNTVGAAPCDEIAAVRSNAKPKRGEMNFIFKRSK